MNKVLVYMLYMAEIGAGIVDYCLGQCVELGAALGSLNTS